MVDASERDTVVLCQSVFRWCRVAYFNIQYVMSMKSWASCCVSAYSMIWRCVFSVWCQWKDRQIVRQCVQWYDGVYSVCDVSKRSVTLCIRVCSAIWRTMFSAWCRWKERQILFSDMADYVQCVMSAKVTSHCSSDCVQRYGRLCSVRDVGESNVTLCVRLCSAIWWTMFRAWCWWEERHIVFPNMLSDVTD